MTYFTKILLSCAMLLCLTSHHCYADEVVFEDMVKYCDHIARHYGKQEARQCILTHATTAYNVISEFEKMIIAILDSVLELEGLSKDDIVEIFTAKELIKEEFLNAKKEIQYQTIDMYK